MASEGRADRLIPHAIYHVNATGEIQQEVPFPPELLVHQERFGAEGITLIDDTLWIAIQRQWQDDPENTVKLLSYNLESEEWGAVRYPTEPAETGWVGLSEIVAHDDYVYIIERDNQIGVLAKIKRVYRVAKSELNPSQIGTDFPLVNKELVRDLIPDLAKLNGYIVDKVEGLAIDQQGNAIIVTDNDGVDDSSGETLFFKINLK